VGKREGSEKDDRKQQKFESLLSIRNNMTNRNIYNNNNNSNNCSNNNHSSNNNDNNASERKSSGGVPVVVYPQWHNWIAGASAGAVARFCTTPLDIIRIRRQLAVHGVQASNDNLFLSLYTLFQGGGIPALFRGNVAAMNLWVGFTAIQFALYNECKEYLGNSPTTMQFLSSMPFSCTIAKDATIAFLSGAMAGTVATISTYPFDICRTAFAARCVHETTTTNATSTTTKPTLRPPKTMIEFVIQFYQLKGAKAFFAGSGPAMLQVVPYMGLNFGIYDTLTKHDDTKQVIHSGLAGSISGALSKIAVYPMDTIKKRLQAQAFLGPISVVNKRELATEYHYKGFVDCATKILEMEGMTAFYRGLVPSVLKTTLASGLSFSMYRFTKNVLESIHDDYTDDNNQSRSRTTTTRKTTKTSTSSSSSLQRTVSATTTHK